MIVSILQLWWPQCPCQDDFVRHHRCKIDAIVTHIGCEVPTMTGPVDDHKTWLAGVFDRAAATYDRVGDPYHEILGRRLLEVADPPAGFALLDVACGRGAVLAAAERAGRRVGVDVSAEMIAQAAADVSDVELSVMDAERLDFDDRTFDLVTCSFAVFFLPHPERAVAEFHRVLRPGGLAALSSWGEDDPRWDWEQDLMSAAGAGRRAIQRPFDRPEELAALLSGAGFDGVRLHREELDIRFADAQQWWDWSWSFSRRGVLERMDAAAVEALRAGAAEHLAAMLTPDGLPMRLVAWFAVGRAGATDAAGSAPPDAGRAAA
jgi:ubiquinone/menaquinone biosynthesis C-methylase UbiE